MRRVLIMGAEGRDLHDFDVCCRVHPDTRLVASNAARVPAEVLAPHLTGWSAR